MSTLPLESRPRSSARPIAKVVPITIVLALVFSVLTHFWPAIPERRGGASARLRHRHLLLVLRADCSRGCGDRATRAGAGVSFTYRRDELMP
jgi:hypothetical protein